MSCDCAEANGVWGKMKECEERREEERRGEERSE
jgi:hypothetical protein